MGLVDSTQRKPWPGHGESDGDVTVPEGKNAISGFVFGSRVASSLLTLPSHDKPRAGVGFRQCVRETRGKKKWS